MTAGERQDEMSGAVQGAGRLDRTHNEAEAGTQAADYMNFIKQARRYARRWSRAARRTPNFTGQRRSSRHFVTRVRVDTIPSPVMLRAKRHAIADEGRSNWMA